MSLGHATGEGAQAVEVGWAGPFLPGSFISFGRGEEAVAAQRPLQTPDLPQPYHVGLFPPAKRVGDARAENLTAIVQSSIMRVDSCGWAFARPSRIPRLPGGSAPPGVWVGNGRGGGERGWGGPGPLPALLWHFASCSVPHFFFFFCSYCL